MRKPFAILLAGLAAALCVVAAFEFGRGEDAARRFAATPAAPPAAPSAPVPAATPTLAPAASAPAPRRPASAPAAPVRAPFGLSSEHQRLVERGTLIAADLRAFEREERDEAWAAEAERRVRAELSAHPGFAGFDIVAIACRSSLCAVQAFSYGEDSSNRWQTAMGDLYRDSLARDFDSLTSAFPAQANRTAQLSFLRRKPGGTRP